MSNFDAEMKAIFDRRVAKTIKCKDEMEKEINDLLERYSDVETHLLNASLNKHAADALKAIENS